MEWICTLSQARVSRGGTLILDGVTLTLLPEAKIEWSARKAPAR